MSQDKPDLKSLSSTSSKICSNCQDLFRKRRPNEDRPRLKKDALASANRGCYFCKWISMNWTSETDLDKTYNFWCTDKEEESTPRLTANHVDGYSSKAWFLLPESEIECQNPRKAYIPSFPARPGDPALSKLATRWLEECKREHRQCRPSNAAFRPTRLIQIIDAKLVKLVTSSDISPDKTANYVAFTHCWGSSKSLKLLKNNQEHLCTGIQVGDLPQSYQEAIATCLGLELEFIWIDSLCIIQDSETDWQQEAATMGTLYGSAALNLCAAAAADNSEASFTARDLSLINPLRISCDWEGEGKREFNVVSIDLQFVDIRSSPLRSRGWIFQEMSLSSSSLLLGRMQLWWHCREKLACETFPDGLPEVFSSFWLADVESIKDKNHETPADRDQWRAMWHARCRRYTQTKFTKERDRLIAFSGVVQKFQNTYAIPNDYVAGLWRFELPAALCWSVSGLGKLSRSPEYKAPSWSWMSLDGPVNLSGVGGSVETQTCCSVEQLWLHHLDETHITGLLRGGALKLRGHLIGPSTIPSDGVLTYELVTEAHDASDTIRKDRVFGLGWDEKDTNSAGMISYLDNLDPDRCQRGLVDGAVRRIISTKHADGSIFYLPITHEQNEPNGTWSLNGIILYQAPNQPKVFHRINDYVLQCSEGTHDNFMAKLSIQHPMRSILIL